MPKKFFSILIFIFLILFIYFNFILAEFFLSPITSKNQPLSVKIYPQENLHLVMQRLEDAHVVDHPVLFKWMVLITGNHFSLHYGEYAVTYPMTEWRLLRNMVIGTGFVQHKLTIINGWTFQDIRNAILTNFDLHQTINTLSNAQVMQQLKSTQQNPEGLFYPDTYYFTWGNVDFSILKTAYTKMQNTLNQAWKNRAPNLPYQNAYQALIVASLIERETPLNSEKPIIASVIINRLAKKMRLQIDPTVLYGLKKSYGAPITKTDLASKTPYNTYQIAGLPPTPICMPGKNAIEAALHPATTDYLYYVANGKGGHNFSATYVEHEKQVKLYRDVMSQQQSTAISK